MINRSKTKMVNVSTICKRCQWFMTKTDAKKRGATIDPKAFGCCAGNPYQENPIQNLYDMPVNGNYIKCRYYKFKPCSGVGNSYAVFHTVTMHIEFITPIVEEAKQMAKRANDPNVIVVKLTKVK